MSSLILNSLEIEGFRVFECLTIDRLGRVNLIVGKNNVGKSCFLEALQIYAHRGSSDTIQDILISRDESDRMSDSPTDINAFVDAIKYLFYERKIFAKYPSIDTFEIGPVADASLRLAVSTQWYEDPRPNLFEDGHNVSPSSISITFGNESAISIHFSEFLDRRSLKHSLLRHVGGITSIFVPANSLDENTLAELWDNVALKSGEEDVLKGMHIVEPGVERVNLIGKARRSTRISMVKMQNAPEPIPLRSLGEGMTRLFGIVLALVNAQDGLLLIDEVDSGLHYTVYPALWRLIFQIAAQLNVQVFATTHSWDCIAGFQQAAQDAENEDGMLIRLERRQEHIVPILFDTSRLSIATRQEIEVR
jgi:predicted ATPase